MSFRPCNRNINKVLLLAACLTLLVLAVSCAQNVLGIPSGEAREKLQAGDASFISGGNFSDAELRTLAHLDANLPFYAGLLVEKAKPDLAQRLYATALDTSTNPVVRQAAAERLAPFCDRNDKAKLRRLLAAVTGGSPALETWRDALQLFADGDSSKGDASLDAWLLSRPVDAAWNWVYKALKKPGPAVSAHFLAASSRFTEALAAFKPILSGKDAWKLFFQYPALIPDLGRAFQYGSTDDAGINLMTDWAQNAGSKLARYRLYHYAGRIARQRNQADKAFDLFTQALALAPDKEQKDACIWYILSVTFNRSPEDLLPALEKYIPAVSDLSYIDDILDRYCSFLCANKKWKDMQSAFALLPVNAGDASRAQYAYILSRIFPTDPRYKAAFLAEDKAPLYYRIMAGSMGKAPQAVATATETAAQPRTAAVPETEAARDTLDFFRGFFHWGAAQYAWPYVERLRSSLTSDVLRQMSDVYYKAKMWPESIKLASYYMGRSDYSFGNNPFLRQDLSYAQPQGYKEMVEKYAHEQGLSPALLFALLRVESAFDANAVSGAGAQGLAQLMKDTARDMAQRYQRTQRLSGSGGGSHSLQKLNLLDPDTSIHLGAYYLRYLEEHNSSTMLALLAYNGGMGRVRKWQAAARDIESDLFIETINIDETRNYGKQVLSCAAVYGWLYYGLSMEEVAADIYREE